MRLSFYLEEQLLLRLLDNIQALCGYLVNRNQRTKHKKKTEGIIYANEFVSQLRKVTSYRTVKQF